jgi:transcription elongation factor GreB
MSKAFTKDEGEGDVPDVVAPRAPLPDGTPNYVTARGLALLHAELARLETERGELTGRDEESRRAAWLRLGSRLSELSARIASAVRIDPPGPERRDQILFGARVHVRAEDGAERTVRIVGVDEADPREGRIAFTAPLARALLGRAVGDDVSFRSPRGSEELEVLRISYEPDPEETPVPGAAPAGPRAR